MVLAWLKRFVHFLKQDNWQAWFVSLLLMFIFVKFIFFPLLSFAFGTRLPLVVVESCSMYHENSFDGWWNRNSLWYDEHDITKSEFQNYPFKNGINKGDVIVVTGRSSPSVGDVIIFDSHYPYPLIHRVVSEDSLSTKGDHNGDQLEAERAILPEQVVGTAIARIPALGWLKLIFFELFRDPTERGFCR